MQISNNVLPNSLLPRPLGTEIELDELGVFCFDETATDLKSEDGVEKSPPIAEPTGDAYLDEFIIPKIICSIEETLEEDKSLSNKEIQIQDDISQKRKKSITWSEDMPTDLSHLHISSEQHNNEDLPVSGLKHLNHRFDEGIVKNRPGSSLSSSDYFQQRRRRSSTLSTASSRKGSNASEDFCRKGSITSGLSSRRSSSVFESPSRKSSLSSSNNSSRKDSICSNSIRKGSTASYISSRKGSSSSVLSSRKSSLSSRKGSASWETQSRSSNISRETQERINRCLDTNTKAPRKNSISLPEGAKQKPRPSIVSTRNSRRNTLTTIPPNVELETLVAANASEPPGDLTLSCILNHIAYVNQTEISAKMGARLKESRKEQVKQV